MGCQCCDHGQKAVIKSWELSAIEQLRGTHIDRTSGSEARGAMLGRALATEPEVLLSDEPIELLVAIA